jgi:hypothetical protein
MILAQFDISRQIYQSFEYIRQLTRNRDQVVPELDFAAMRKYRFSQNMQGVKE